jgi:hypothetical protein
VILRLFEEFLDSAIEGPGAARLALTPRLRSDKLASAMPFSTPVAPPLMKQFKSAANGLTGRAAAEAIVQAVLAHFKAEVTVLDRHGIGELFRVGSGDPSHGIHGIHIHPISIQWGTWDLKAHKDAIAFLPDENLNMYVGSLLQALETGCYRAGFKHR